MPANLENSAVTTGLEKVSFHSNLKERQCQRPFMYDLNQIPYDYTVEVTNRFKGLDLLDRVPEELWMEVQNTVQETVIKTIPMKSKLKKGKMKGLHNS